ncbi:MAG: disulfide bond formation protein B [Myxococcota bacterium]|jgi:disulfide bond formation protein DsbB|nr:disulfide bond formation protein B [Myxococcota bacterium]
MSSVEQKDERARVVLFASWLLAATATLGSLFFSEVMQLPPCSLCWVQRIFMFPLAIILLVGLFPLDTSVVRYALPLALCGIAVSLYHTLLQVGIIPETAAPCQQGVSCSSVSYELFGFVSIPMLSLLAFLGVSGLLLTLKRSELK